MKDKNQVQKRRGRPPGSHNQQKITSFHVAIPKQLATKIESLAVQTGVNQDRIALCALVDGLRNWEGIHETLINYNASVDTIIRESGFKKKALPITSPRENAGELSPEARTREVEIEAELRNLESDKRSGGSTHISPDDDALLGHGESGAGDGAGQEFNAAIHGE